MCCAKSINGIYRICNTFHVTKMLVNHSCDEIIDWDRHMLSKGLLSSSTVYTVSGDLESGNTEIRTIDQLTSFGEVGSFWVFATVCSIETEHSWWYLACNRCPKKVNCVGTRFYCEKCDRFDNSGHPRFKIQKSELDSFPIEVESLVDREIMFKVQVRDQDIKYRNVVYTTMRVTVDAGIISKHVKSNDNRYSNVISTIEKTEVEDEKVTTPMKESIINYQAGGKHEQSVAKRSLTGDLSTNIIEKKYKAVVKKEKE